MNAQSISTPSTSLTPTPPDARQAMQIALDEYPHLRRRKNLAALRSYLVGQVNVVVTRGKQLRPEDRTKNMVAEYLAAISAVFEQKGLQGVAEYLDAQGKMTKTITTGQALHEKYYHGPLRQLRDRNFLARTPTGKDVLSSTVNTDTGFDARRRHLFVSNEWRNCLEARRCESIDELRNFEREIQTMHIILDLAATLGIDEKVIQEAKGQGGIRSGLINLIDQLKGENTDLSYLEIGVFAECYARRKGVKRHTPLTFANTEAKQFMRDFDSEARWRDGVLDEYHNACDEAFSPEQQPTAHRILDIALSSIGELLSLYTHTVPGSRPPGEFFFPVHYVSDAAKNQIVRINEGQEGQRGSRAYDIVHDNTLEAPKNNY